jgi:phosphonatase-like hydrolase
MHTESIKLAIFDMAGTTVYDDHYVTKALCEALQLHGYDIPLSAADAVMGIAKPVAIKMLLEQFYPGRAAEAPVPGIHADFLRLMTGFYESSPDIREIEGTSAVFRILKEQGVKVGLDTGFSRDITDIIVARLGWHEAALLDISVASDEVEQGRPAPDMIFKAMEQLGISDVKSVAKIGDTPVDIQEGLNAGCGMVIGVLSGVGTKEELGGYEDTLLASSVLDVPGMIRAYEAEQVAG